MDNLWDLNASMNSSDGTFVSGDNAITGISFNDDGTFSASGDTTIQFDFNGISSNQSVVFDPAYQERTTALHKIEVLQVLQQRLMVMHTENIMICL